MAVVDQAIDCSCCYRIELGGSRRQPRQDIDERRLTAGGNRAAQRQTWRYHEAVEHVGMQDPQRHNDVVVGLSKYYIFFE